MINDLQKFGKWLNDNDQVDFGKNVSEEDYILIVSYHDEKFTIESLDLIKNSSLNYYKFSCFNENLYHSTDQKVIIPSKSNLLGFTPFFIKLDHKFTKNNEKDDVAIGKFKNKIDRSINANNNNKEFCSIASVCFDDFDEFLSNCLIADVQKEHLNNLYEQLELTDVKNLIVSYYTFICENSDELINRIIDFKKSDDFTNKSSNFFIACIFENINDMLNDLFFYYSCFIQSTSKKFEDYDNGVCTLCGSKSIVYPPLPYYSINSRTSFNITPDIKNSKLRICKKCSSYLKYSTDKLSKILNVPNLLIIPKNIVSSDYSDFLKISNKYVNSFDRINLFLKYCNNFNFDLIIYNENKGLWNIKRYIENYNAFLVRFENLYLYDGGSLKFLFNRVCKIL